MKLSSDFLTSSCVVHRRRSRRPRRRSREFVERKTKRGKRAREKEATRNGEAANLRFPRPRFCRETVELIGAAFGIRRYRSAHTRRMPRGPGDHLFFKSLMVIFASSSSSSTRQINDTTSQVGPRDATRDKISIPPRIKSLHGVGARIIISISRRVTLSRTGHVENRPPDVTRRPPNQRPVSVRLAAQSVSTRRGQTGAEKRNVGRLKLV